MFALRYLRRLLTSEGRSAPRPPVETPEPHGEQDAVQDSPITVTETHTAAIDMEKEEKEETETDSDVVEVREKLNVSEGEEEEAEASSEVQKRLDIARTRKGKSKSRSNARRIESSNEMSRAAKANAVWTRTGLKTVLRDVQQQQHHDRSEDACVSHSCGACFDAFSECNQVNEEQESVASQISMEGDDLTSSVDNGDVEPDEASDEEVNLGFIFPCQNQFCYGCLSSYILGRIKDAGNGTNLLPLSCPECRKLESKPDCITEDHVKRVLSPEEWEQFEQAVILESMANKVYCPNTACGAVFDAQDVVMEDADIAEGDNKVACPACKKVACIKCNIAWHTGFTCEEYKSRPQFLHQDVDDHEATLEMAKKSGWRRCPRPTCGHMIEHTSGCNHITCICGEEFCFLCLAPWLFIRDEAGLVTGQRCSRGNLGGRPACPLYTEDGLSGVQPMQELHFRRHSMHWIQEDRTGLPYQKSNTFTRHMLASRQCGYCQYKGKRWPRLIEHLETTTHDVFDCCAKFFETREAFDSHVRNAHPSRVWASAASVRRT